MEENQKREGIKEGKLPWRKLFSFPENDAAHRNIQVEDQGVLSVFAIRGVGESVRAYLFH